jgi:hypothetical protein
MRILMAVGIFLAVVSASAEPAYYRVELLPSGSLVVIGAPVARGTMLLVHGYPDGKLMSLRKKDVRSVTPITAQDAAEPAKKSLVPIGNLAMQGGAAATTSSTRPSPARSRAQGPSVVATRDGLAVTTGSPARASAAAGPGVVATSDGLAIMTPAPAAAPPAQTALNPNK